VDLPKSQTIFRPAEVGRASEDVALQIEAAVMSGRIPMGERLPSERSLQVLFHSSRGVIREALRALKQKGMIEVKKGARGGAFIKNLEVFDASEPLALFLKQHNVPPNLLIEFRESIDRTITLLAISRGGPQEKQTLVDKTTAFEHLLGTPAPDMQTVAEMDRELNLLLVKMTCNPMFEMVMRTIQMGFSSLDQVLYEHVDYRALAAANWRDTAVQIAAGEALQALSHISYHYVLLQRCIAQGNQDKSAASPEPAPAGATQHAQTIPRDDQP
jgi:GntR family transcriptional regulator, transcriptional repressor for pyruvate dehydrogenase complex